LIKRFIDILIFLFFSFLAGNAANFTHFTFLETWDRTNVIS